MRHRGSEGLWGSSGLSGTDTQQFHFFRNFLGGDGALDSGATELLVSTHNWQSWGVLGGVGVGSAVEEQLEKVSSRMVQVNSVVRDL